MYRLNDESAQWLTSWITDRVVQEMKDPELLDSERHTFAQVVRIAGIAPDQMLIVATDQELRFLRRLLDEAVRQESKDPCLSARERSQLTFVHGLVVQAADSREAQAFDHYDNESYIVTVTDSKFDVAYEYSGPLTDEQIQKLRAVLEGEGS